MQQALASCGAALLATAASFVLYAARAEEVTLQFQASKDPEIRRAQTDLVQTYAYVTYYYVNADFEGADWQGAFERALRQSQAASGAAVVDALTDGLLAQLHDPYTRRLGPQAAAVFRAEQQGKLLSYGLGLDCGAAQSTGACDVAYVAPNGPAQLAGVTASDAVTAFDGQKMDADTSGCATPGNKILWRLKAQLEARDQPSITLTVAPAQQQAPQQGTQAQPARARPGEQREVTLRSAAVDIDPVQFSTVRSDDGAAVGYVRIGTFAETTPRSVQRSLQRFQQQGTAGIVVDLRDNPGGQVNAGRETANHLLPSDQILVTAGGRGSFADVVLSSDASDFTLRQPVAVLANGNTASVSEMLAAALRARGATLVGEPTHGKSRSQKAIDLDSGSLLLVSMLKYIGANGEQFDAGGIAPDVKCVPESVGETRYEGGEVSAGQGLREDPCIDLAVRELATRRA